MIKTIPVLIASTTTVAGGATVLGEGTLVTAGVFIGGVCAVCGAAYWLGQRMLELKQIGQRLQEGAGTFADHERRITTLEGRCSIIHGPDLTHLNNQTQRMDL